MVSIGDNAFRNCTGLTYFDIPATTASIGISAFEGCSGLTSFRFESGSVLGGISDRTFYECTGLLSVSLPESITEIGESAFYGCTELALMSVPANVTSMSLGEGLESIGESAFYNCSALTDLQMPKTINSIGNHAFYNCLSINTVRVENPEPPVAYANTFNVDTYLNATLSVPAGSRDAYSMAECWYNFRNKEEFPFGSVGAIGNDTLKVYFEGANLVIEGAGEDDLVDIYNVGGQLVYSGYDTIVEGLAHGVYLVRVAGSTIKVVL